MFSPLPPTATTWNRPAAEPCSAWLRAACALQSSTSPRAKPARAAPQTNARAEAAEAAKLLGVGWRQALNLPDGAVENTLENRIEIARVLRLLRPRVVILPYWQARHPDHAVAGTLGYDACFLSGLEED